MGATIQREEPDKEWYKIGFLQINQNEEIAIPQTKICSQLIIYNNYTLNKHKKDEEFKKKGYKNNKQGMQLEIK